ncbi:hypothetical protein F7734_43280 [Scytonema sp. UIC 10036]|uniref:hypothetical protein n=1 Tax=Scytonema sp. UIC 10036 TaxID=2304196 RepID=UPI0012DAEDA8|nr:hypothetical protein [Scytonema sp. UIC 10036]MUG98757.1 hypothetical protein [Scytonema sp. UIC 10036]
MNDQNNRIAWLLEIPSRIQKGESPTVQDVENIIYFFNLIQSLFDWVIKQFPNQSQVSVLTYKDTIEFFIKKRPTNPEANKGVLLRQYHPKGFTVIQLFLDSKNDLICYPDGKPYGRVLIAEKFDAELSEIFNNKMLVLFE